MTKFPRKTALAGAAILAATVYAFAAQLAPGQGGMHEQMMGQMGGMHEQMVQRMQGQNLAQGMPGAIGMHGHGAAGGPTMPGQDAFGTIQEIVQILEADPATDWSKVNIAALREHLIDMNEVTLHATASQHIADNSLVVEVTGEGRTLAAIKRMVPEHVHMLQSMSWNAKTADLANGVTLTVTAADAPALARLKALGFIGIMVQGGHHQQHHLMVAKGQFPVH
jgi:hypothetical protein